VQPPSGQMLDGMLDVWDAVREPANILLLLDTSISMGDPTSDGSSTRLEMMQSAAAEGVHRLVHLSHDVGLWTFPGSEGRPYDEAVPLGSLTNTQEDEIEEAIGALRRAGPTPLYRAIQGAQDELLRYAAGEGPSGEAARVNAVVVLTDGGNSDPDNDDPQTADVETFVREVLIPAQGDSPAEQVAVFTIAFDFDDPAAYDALGRISEATDGVRYDARDPEALADVFVEVLSSF
jgi:Ca-activated chloride channel family protein